MCPLNFSTAHEQYFSALEYASPGHGAKFPFLIALSHVDLTGFLAVACIYHTSASTLGRLYALCAAGAVCLVYV